jgi:hypothetical protein
MARQRGLNINLTDLLAARLLADEDEMTPPQLARKLDVINGWGIMDRLERAGWVHRTRFNYGPSSFSLSRRGRDVLKITILMIRNSTEQTAT